MSQVEFTKEYYQDTEKPETVTNTRGTFELKGRLLTYYKQGYYEPGWGLHDYNRNSIDGYGWECYPTWGTKGAKKSNRLMDDLFQIYGDWELVHKHIVMQPLEFTELLKPQGRIPMIGWDDIAAWFDSQLYFENRGLYTNIKRCWTLMRTKLNVFSCTLPNKAELPGFIIKDMTAEAKNSPRLTRTYDRWTLSKHLFDPRKIVMRPVCVFRDKPFDMLTVPTSEFKRYWERRMGLAEIATHDLVSYLEEAFEDPPNIHDYIDEQIEGGDTREMIIKLAAKLTGTKKPETRDQAVINLVSAVQKSMKQ